MITIPADNMNASLIEFMEQCLARIEAEVEIRLCAARKLRAEANGAKTNGTISGSQSDGHSQTKKRALARRRLRSRKRVKANSFIRNSEVGKSCK